jgi:triacylglycerol esterase/lipase EstA (alpha/beta hydrolase family)
VLDGLSPARKRFVLGVVALALLAATAAGGAAWLGREEPVRPVSQETPGPVLLVPGYGGGVVGLEVLAEALRAQGRDVTVVDLPGDNTGDLDRQAGELANAAILTLNRTGARSLDVVGYSAGGVVARLWVREHGGGSLARRVVTLGSPHHGTDLAGLGGDLAPDSCPEACRQLQPDSELLRRLNAGDETPDGPLWVSIWTTDDRVVVPQSSSELDGALGFTLQSVCPRAVVSHGDLPQDPIVIAAVTRELAVAEPAVPGPEIC